MQRARLFLVSLLSAATGFGAGTSAAPDEPSHWRATAFEKARETALLIEDPYRRAEALARLARTHADHDDAAGAHRAVHQALEASRQVQEPAFRDWVLHDIALAQLRVDDVHGARETTRRIETERPQGAALTALADRALRAGDLKSADAIAANIRDPGARGLVLRQLVIVRVARGEMDPAYATLKTIADPFYETLARGDLAAAEVRAGRIERAHAAAARAPRRDRAGVYSRIAVERAAVGDLSGSLETHQLIKDELSAALVQSRIAAAYVQAGDAAPARSLFDAALAAAQRAPSSPRRALTLAQLARLQLASGHAGGAGVLAVARAEAVSLAPGEERDDALAYIASAQARAAEASAALDTALHLTDRAARALLVRDIVTLLSAADAAPAAASFRAFEDPLIEAAALFGVLGVQSLHAGKSISTEAIDAARSAVHRMDGALQPAALSALAAARLSTGDAGSAAAIFREALSAAEAVERPDQRALAYVRIIDALNDRLMFLGEPPKPAASGSD